MILSCASCSVSNAQEYHLAYANNMTNEKTGRRVIFSDGLYYIGKIKLDRESNGFTFEKISSAPEFATKVVEAKLSEWEENAKVYDVPSGKFVAKTDPNYLNVLMKNFTMGRVVIIKSSIGDKYFSSDKSLSEGDELKNAITTYSDLQKNGQ